jgi:hypothetical protein
MARVEFYRFDFPIVIRRGDDGATVTNVESPVNADRYVNITPAGVPVPSIPAATIREILDRWLALVAPEPRRMEDRVVLPRVALDIRDPELEEIAWEELLRSAIPQGVALVRRSSVWPRAEAIAFTLPYRILQVDPVPGREIAAMVPRIFGGHPVDVIARAILTSTTSVTDSGELRPDSSWPTVDVLHFDRYPVLTVEHLLSTAHADEPYTLGWLARFTNRYQTRLVVIDCENEAEAAAARALAAALVAKGGPAVLVSDVPAEFYDYFYDWFIHDFPCDSILASVPWSLPYQPSLFAGAGREDSLRASNVALGLLQMRQMLIEQQWYANRTGLRSPDFQLRMELDRLQLEWPTGQFEFHEREGLIPLAEALERIRGLSPPDPKPVSFDVLPEERFVNSGLWHEGMHGTLERLPAEAGVSINELYHLGIQIGPRDTLMQTARAQALIEDIFRWDPELKGAWVEVGVTGLDFEVSGDPVQELWLPRVGATEMIHFAVTPRTGCTPVLRFSLYHRNNVVQSFRLAARTMESRSGDLAEALDISPEEVRGGHMARLEYSLVSDLDMLSDRPARAVSIVTNHMNGRPAITVKANNVFDVRTNNDLPKYVQNVRRSLLDISRIPVKDADVADWPYRFQGPSELMRNKATPEILKDTLPAIAKTGWELFNQVIPTKQRPGLRAALDPERQLIHVAHLLREKVIPWAAIYDRQYDEGKSLDANGDPVAKAVCLAAMPGEDGVLPATRCGVLKDCELHPDKILARKNADGSTVVPETVVCPLHFWGFKHIIEIPPQQVDDTRKAVHAQSDRVCAAATAELVAGVNSSLGLAKSHLAELATLVQNAAPPAKWIASESNRDLILDKLKHTGLDFIYLYCHARGGESDPGIHPPCLNFDGKPVTSADLACEQPWSHAPLVFLNGCGTLGCSPDALSPFIGALVDDRGASGIIGAEIPVWEQFASEFAKRFLEGFLKGLPVGDVLLDARRALLAQYNPLGVVYTLYAAAQLALERS